MSNFYLLFLIIDLLILPKVFFSTPISILLLPLFIILHHNLSRSNITVFALCFSIILTSVYYSAFIFPENTSENLKRGLQLCFILLILFYDFNDNKVDFNVFIKRLKFSLFYFYLFILVVIFIFYFKSDLYVSFMTYFYSESTPMLITNLEYLRFAFHFTDPNSLGYMIVLVLSFLLSLKLSYREIIFFIVCSLVIILTTQSRGALVSFGLVILSYFLFFLENTKFKISLVFLLSLSCIVLYVLFSEYLDAFFSLMQHRSEIEDSMGKGVGGGRIDSWLYFLNNFNLNPFFGVGYILQVDGKLYRPHSDFIRLNLSYGIMIYFLLGYVLRGFTKKHVMLFFAFLIPFFINTIIDDYRLFVLFIVFFNLIRVYENNISLTINATPNSENSDKKLF